MASSSHESNVVWDLRERAARAFELSRQVLLSNQWRLVSQSPRGDVHTMVEPNVGRLYMVTVTINTSASRLRKILIDSVESYPKWSSVYVKDSCKRVMLITACDSNGEEVNYFISGEQGRDHPTIRSEYPGKPGEKLGSGWWQKAHVLDEGIDVTYAVTQARLGGLVAPRDWLTLRVWRDYTNPQGFPETISTGVNVQLPEYPPGRKCVRGETLLGTFTITDLGQEGGAPRSLFRFITAVRLGGWLPRSITELYVTDGIVQFADDVRRRVKDAEDP